MTSVNRGEAAAQLAVALVVFLLVLLVWTLTHAKGGVAAALERGGTPVAPSFSVGSVRGSRPINLASYGGRVIVVNFWASWCGPCRAETPSLVHAWRHWHSHLVTFVGLDTRDATTDARAFVRSARVSYPVGHDGSGRTARAYGVGALPATFVIAPRGHIVARFLGPVSEQELGAAIERALRRAGAA